MRNTPQDLLSTWTPPAGLALHTMPLVTLWVSQGVPQTTRPMHPPRVNRGLEEAIGQGGEFILRSSSPWVRHTWLPPRARFSPILYDKRLPSQQRSRLLTSRLPMTLHCLTWLGHSLSRLHAIHHGVMHMMWVGGPSAHHAWRFHTRPDPLIRKGRGKEEAIGQPTH